MTTERAPPGGPRTRRTQDLVAAAEGTCPPRRRRVTGVGRHLPVVKRPGLLDFHFSYY
jgi:hypothetical protein